MSDVCIQIDNLSKSFKNTTILNNVNCEFQRGRIYGIIGENGCGKTVLLKLICGFLYPSSGDIIVNNKTIGKDADFPDDIGILIETPGFLPYYSGFNNLLFLSQIKNRITKNQIASVMKQVGLDPDNKMKVSKYSLGMLQRLAFAQAIMENPNILILDELFNSLDESGIETVKTELIKIKNENKTIILTSHNKSIINEICDDIYMIKDGCINKVSI